MRDWKSAFAFGVSVAFAGAAPAFADTVLDLTSVGASATDQGVIYQQMSQQPTGTGVIQSFVRIEQNSHEQGYNTDNRPVQFDEKSDATYTHSLQLTSLNTVKIGGTSYYQFLLDINQNKTSTGRYLSLNEVEIFQTNDNKISGYTTGQTTAGYGLDSDGFGSTSQMIYNLDHLSDKQIKLDYSLNSGSGSGDMYMYVPTSKFVGGYSDVVLYSFFGLPNTSDAGFEEWATVKGTNSPATQTPLPQPLWASVILLGGFGIHRRFGSRRVAGQG